jgi:hypothetical protein
MALEPVQPWFRRRRPNAPERWDWPLDVERWRRAPQQRWAAAMAPPMPARLRLVPLRLALTQARRWRPRLH